NIPLAERRRRGYYAVGGNGGSPTWHTPNDLPPVASLPILRRDLEGYLTTIVRVLNAPIYPFDYAAAVDEMKAAGAGYRDRAGSDVDLGAVVDDFDRLRQAFAKWRGDAEGRVSSADAAERRRINGTLRQLARILVPLNYARGERFDHDPAVKLPVVPR